MFKIKLIIKSILWPANILNGMVVIYKVPQNWVEAKPMLAFFLNDWVRIFQLVVFIVILIWLVWPLITNIRNKEPNKKEEFKPIITEVNEEDE